MRITIVGSGRVGSSTAALIGALGIARRVTLIDVVQGLPQGEAEDLNHMAAALGVDVEYEGTNDFAAMRGSELVIVTAGMPRKPGMTREQLLGENAKIVADVYRKIRNYAPNAVTILTTNPLDAMVYVAWRASGLPRERVIGFSGALDTARLAYYASKRLGISPASITAVVLGQHGEKMVPAPHASNVLGIPLSRLLGDEVRAVAEETVKAGARITELRGFSSNWAPAAGLAMMARAVLRDERRVVISSVVLMGEYGYSEIPLEVPVVIGGTGVAKVLEIPLTDEERRALAEAAEAVKALIAQIPAEALA